MTTGPRVGAIFLLDLVAETRIGRGVDCNIVLTDPLCSRVHAVVRRKDHSWQVADAQSSNGTYVNNQKIDEAVLSDGNHLRLGTTEFLFRVTEQPPTIGDAENLRLTQTLIRNQPISGRDAEAQGLGAIADARQAQELLLLYQLCIRLLSCNDPDEVTRISLELLREWTHATVAGFLWLDDTGQLRPRIVIPDEAAEQVALSESLTEMVFEQGNAIWIASQKPNSDTDTLKHFADALCMPLVYEGTTLGAIHIYLERGRFRQSHFDFSISLANITAVALARARRETKLTADYQQLVEQSPGHAEMIGQSPPMVDLKNKINRLAKASGSVLVRGESGSGKELVARALHRASPRADRPMLSVNCAAIPRELMESQLFGHKAGAFTSADRDHSGYFQQADLGTLFLDEVGELTLEGQAKLLRILEGHPFLPVGGTKQVSVDVRVIAATNQDLQKYVRERKFREDLYYRLGVFELRVPPLRERGGDVGLLIDFFLEHFKKQHGRPGLTFNPSAREKLVAYHWPGNVRQLRNVIDSAVVLAEGAQIEANDLGLRDSGSNELDTLNMEYWERRLIDEALRRTNGNVPDAAQLLGLGRATLYRKLAERQGERG
jgi:Nif-specific regulatory protein